MRGDSDIPLVSDGGRLNADRHLERVGSRLGGWRDRIATAALIVFAAQSVVRVVFLFPPTWRALSLHLSTLALIVSAAALLLAVPRPSLSARLATAILLAIFNAVLWWSDILAVASRIYGTGPYSIPLLVNMVCAGSLDMACASRYPLAFSTGIGIFLVSALLFWFIHGALRARVQWLLGLAAHVLPRRRWMQPVPAMAAFCLLYPLAHLGRWDAWVRFEPVHGLFFQPFLAGPAELLSPARPPAAIAATPGVRPRPLVLIIVDSLRDDEVVLSGEAPTLTPFLRSLALEGRLKRYDSAFSACAYSYCGIMAVLGSAGWAQLQSGRPTTLADVLAVNRIPSYYLLSGVHRRFYNYRELYGANVAYLADEDSFGGAPRDDYALLSALERLHIANPRKAFLFIHLMSVHAAGRRHPRIEQRLAMAKPRWPLIDGNSVNERYVRNHDLGVAQADDVIRRIFGELRRRGMLESALVVISADHGERLELAGAMGHGGEPDVAVSRVPLLIYDAQAPRYAERPVASVLDIAPTMLHAIGAPAPGEWAGVPLQSATPRPAVPVDSRLSFGMAAHSPEGVILYTCAWRSGLEAVTDGRTGSALSGEKRRRALHFARRLYAALPQRREPSSCPRTDPH